MIRSRRRLAAGALVAVLVALAGAPAGAESDPPAPAPEDLAPAPDGVTPAGEPVVGSKDTSSTLAETDPELLARGDGEVVPVVIKLDYDAIAVYAGGRDGLAATSPSVTGDPLTQADVTTGAYARQVARDEAAIVADIEAAVPSAEIGQSLRVVYGGVAARIPARAVEAVLAVDGVVAVQADTPNQLLTDATPSFIGADDVWPQVGGQASAGSGVIFGTLDTGVWPEHPQLADTGVTAPAPPKADATPRACVFGDNPLTPAADVFACNDKLIGGQAFMATYDAEVGDDVYVDTARDSDGHGTHTTTTAAGNPVASATVNGVERGPISGLAPGAWVSAYKVCGPAGCYGSDSAAAVQQAILDGVDVINFSIGGGSNPATDVAELAFLDAYGAGLFVSASAGNSGPGADTVDHLGPWVTTVAATSPNRDFTATLTLGNGATYTGLNIQGAVPSSPLVDGATALLPGEPGGGTCTGALDPAKVTGKIVLCERSPGRVAKSHRVLQAGGVGMVLYNPSPLNVSAENHWVPTVHVDEVTGPAVKAYIAGTASATASISAGTKTPSPGDVIAPFSSRGPGGLTVKPDVGAPGQNVLAGHTPTPGDPNGGPPGNYYRVIDGTSMAAPHVAGAAILLRDAHPDWTPGMVRSALTGSASPTVTSNGGPATPFDTGSGRIQVDAAAAPGLLLDETAARFTALGTDPAAAVHLNLAQVSAPSMPGRLRTTRTVTNPGAPATYTATTTAGSGTTISVEPSTFTLGTGASQVVEITIETTAAVGTQQFGSIVLAASGRSDTRLPVSLTVAASELALTGLGCTPDPVAVPQTSTCSYELANEGYTDAVVDLRAEGDASATVTGATLGATTAGGVATADDVPLPDSDPGVPSTAFGASPFGYVGLHTFASANPIGDEQIANYTVPAFVFGDRTYTRVGVGSNGVLLLGGSTDPEDNACCTAAIGSPTRPNDVLAPFWTDLDGTGRPGFYITVLTDNVDSWLVVEWRVGLYGVPGTEVFQTWIGLQGTEDVSFAYDPANPPDPHPEQNTVIGAENRFGEGTTSVPGTTPTGDARVTSVGVTPGATVQWDVTVQGAAAGTAEIEAEATSDAHPGTVVAVNELEVEAEPLPVVTDDPDDLTVDALATASFTAAATGGTLARWERLPSGGSTWATVPGATSTTLSFTAHGADDGAQYRAVFANTTGGETTTDAATLTVELLDSTTTVSVDPASPVRGQDVTFTATVAPATATGTVQFALDGTPVGGPVTVAAGSATSSAVSDTAAGPHTVTATYSGDGDHTGSTDDAPFTVARNGSTTTIVEITSGVIGEDTPVDATITVVPAPTGGTVELTVDGAPYGSPLTLDAGGSVETTLTGLAPGSRTIVARFTGDDDLDPSEDEVTITVYAAEEAFVRRAYQVVLGRNGDETGIAYWVGRIEGGMDRTALIDHFARSAEGRGRLVNRVFGTALDRPASASDRTYWGDRVLAGLTPEDLLATLLTSIEGLINAEGTPEGLAEKLYDAHLVRTPSTGEVEYWTGRISAAPNLAQVRQVAKQFGRMPEATQVALVETARLVCGTTTFPPGVADELRSRWLAAGRDPLRLAGDTLALLCPSSSAPPV